MKKEMMFRIALLIGVCFATGAQASVLFQDDLDGTPGVDIVGTVPDVGGNAWTGFGIQPGGQIHFAPGGGVQDVGPNSPVSNTEAHSTLLTPFLLSSLAAGEVLHLQVTMANISATPSTNPFASTRVDLITNTSGEIFLGGMDSGTWDANSRAGNPISSGITTSQSGLFVLDLYLDPNDAIGDGVTLNAVLTVNGGSRACGTIVGLSVATLISQVRLVRNIDDEVFFRGLTVETIGAPPGCPPIAVHPSTWTNAKTLYRE